MLALYDVLTGNEEVDKIIERFISERLLGLMQFDLDMYYCGMLDGLKNLDPDDEELYFSVTEDISPDNVSKRDANEAFISMVELLESDQELDPSILQNYQLYQLISGYCDLAEDTGAETIERFPMKDRLRILKELEDIARESECTPEDIIEEYEDIMSYDETCFTDWDFLQLDRMDFEALKSSDANDFLGMIEPEETLNMKAQILKFPSGINKDNNED
ncbi:hypothetical protein [Butyrivibrio sp. AE3004]|uniref:hypothetical protein n=1 Tax=Butyrivibrio sp. AE3004 TaxID=1506994 RepID=UPI000494D1F9|nr:hypothetical protein [Butyrivibrio sp. AE3004]